MLEQKDHQLDRIQPKEILVIVKQHFMEEDGSIPLDFPSDKYITAKVSNLKSMAKKEGHRNIMLGVHLYCLALNNSTLPVSEIDA